MEGNRMKTLEECKIEIAKKYGFGKLVTGHQSKYFDEAAELYASQFFNEKDMVYFSYYLRNGLTNLEYCEKDEFEHLNHWIKDIKPRIK